jgi:hypothetical protein
VAWVWPVTWASQKPLKLGKKWGLTVEGLVMEMAGLVAQKTPMMLQVPCPGLAGKVSGLQAPRPPES